jgi:hypothetical protein
VPNVKQKAALLAGAVAGAVAAVFIRNRRGAPEAPGGAADPRAAELREKLAQAREEAADEDDFEAAGMGAETIVADEAPAAAVDPEVDAARRRVHEQGRAAAEEMRRSAEPKPEAKDE